MIRILLVVSLLVVPALAHGQSGPLTEDLPLEEPKTFSFRIGPLLVSPNLSLKDLGVDSNVFNEAENPKQDWTATVSPELRMFARLGLMQAVASATNDFTYFAKYESERSVSRQFRGRLDASLSRIHPWVSAARLDVHDRPNREIDTRARRKETELSTGVSFAVSPLAGVYAMATRLESQYAEEEAFNGVSLDQALSRRSDTLSGGVKIQATPFTTMLISGSSTEDQFVASPDRNSTSRAANLGLEFSRDAVIRGRASVGFQDFEPADRSVAGFQGIISSGRISYTLLGRATVDNSVTRQVTYSYDAASSYYVETGLDLTYTQLLAGPYDAQARGSRRWQDYTRTRPGVTPVVDAFQFGLGYNFQDKSRIALNYEYSQRVEVERPDRVFHNRRFFASYSQELAR